MYAGGSYLLRGTNEAPTRYVTTLPNISNTDLASLLRVARVRLSFTLSGEQNEHGGNDVERNRRRVWPIALVSVPAAVGAAVLMTCWSTPSQAAAGRVPSVAATTCARPTATVAITQTNTVVNNSTQTQVRVQTQVGPGQTRTQTAHSTTTHLATVTLTPPTVTVTPLPVTLSFTATQTETQTVTVTAPAPPAGLLAPRVQAKHVEAAVQAPYLAPYQAPCVATITNKVQVTNSVTNTDFETTSVTATQTRTADKASFSHDARVAVGVGGVAISGVAGFVFLRMRRRGDYTL